MTPPWRESFGSSRRSPNTDGVQTDQARRSDGGCRPEGHQEYPSQRVSPSWRRSDLGTEANEPRHDPPFRRLTARLDPAAAEEAARAGARIAARVHRAR